MSDSLTKVVGGRPRGGRRREALLEATINLIGESGIDNVTHRNVAQAASLPLASTTYWFASKDELLEQAFQYAADRDIALLESRLAYGRALGAPATAISILLLPPDSEELTISRPRAIAAYALWLKAARRRSLRRVASRWTDAYITAVSELLSGGGSTQLDDAKLLVAAVDGLVLDQLARRTALDLRRKVERLALALLAAH